MKAMRVAGSREKPILLEAEISRPKPQHGEVLVRIRAAGITRTELVWDPTWRTKSGEPREGAVPSHEFSGEIAELGNGVMGLSTGAAIYGMNDWYQDGALAEYCITRPDWIAPMPGTLDHPEAASVPLDALTAWQGLFVRTKLQRAEHVLIHGGAGAVGIFAIQLAHRRGAHVITTVSPHNFDFVKELGADQVIDYKTAPFEEQTGEVDVVFDAVGGETLRRSLDVLKPNGRLVTIVSPDESGFDDRTKQAFFIVEPDRQQLLEIGQLIDSGQLRPFVDVAAPFSQAAEAYQGKIQKKGRGKVVVDIASGS
jgi:NADPH:quinone reductase-like Zn-dependent oxidoreductase